MKTIFIDKIPQSVSAYFSEKGIDTSNALLALRSDMLSNGQFGDCFIYLTNDELAVAEGCFADERFEASRFESFKLDSLGKTKSEQLISTGRVVALINGEPTFIYNYSSSCKHSAAVLCRALSDIRKKGKIDESDYIGENYENHVCPKCGKRYPEGDLKICPNCADTAKLVKRLGRMFFRYKRAIATILLSFAAIAALGIATPYISNELLYDDVLGNPNSVAGDVFRVVALIVIVRIASLIVNLISGVISSTIAADITYDLKKTIFNAISDLSLGFFTNRQTGGLMTQINSDSQTLYRFFCDGFPFLILNIVQLAAIMIVMLMQNTILAIYAFITIPVFFVAFKLMFAIFKKYHAKVFSKRRSFNSLVSDVLNGMRVVKTFSREDVEMERFTDRSEGIAEAMNDVQTFGAKTFPFLNYLLRIGSYVVWAVGGWQVMSGTGDLSYGRLMAFIGYFALMYGPIEQLADVSNWWGETLNAIQRLFEILDAKPDVRESQNPVLPKESRGEVEFRNVSFSYVENRKVIDDVSFKIPAEETLGIVGQTGAGKSTLANLLTRLYDVKQGAIFIDGVNIKDLPFDYLRRNIAIVSQETYLFCGSILDNIRYACPEATREQVIAAAKAASAHDFIIKYPDGYDTEIGFGKKELSGGEKQRVSIARALLSNPKILILDEATAAMDTQTERNIQAALDKLTKNRTTVIIAHRLSTLRNADRLIALENGTVAESGTAQELLKQKGVYWKLYKLQAEALKTVGIE